MKESLQLRIQERYATLPDSERKVADLVLDFPGEIAAYSATELADLAGASKAAVTRLIQRLGYAGFEEARRAARDARREGSPLYLLTKDAEQPSLSERLRSYLARDLENLTRTFEWLDSDSFNELVKALCEARRVWLLGFRNSHYLAGYLRWQLIQVRSDVHLLPAGGETLAEYLAGFEPDDVLVVLGMRRRPREIGEAVALAAGQGTRVLLIADRGAAPMAGATWSLRCEVRGDELFDRYTAVMSLLHFVAVAVVDRLGKPGRRRLERIETLHEDFHDFD